MNACKSSQGDSTGSSLPGRCTINNTGVAARTVHELNEEQFGLYIVSKASHDDTWWSETDDEYCSSLMYMWCDLILFLAKPFVHVRVAMPHNLNRHAVIMCHI